MRIKYFVLCCLFVSVSAFSQKNFVKGIIEDVNGKTIKGYINYQNWKQNPVEISFKESLDSPIKTFSAINLHSFNVSEDIYLSKKVSVDKASRRSQSLSYKFIDKNEIKKVFLKLIYKSEKSLYHFIDIDGKEHFYIDKGDNIEELIYKVALINSRKTNKKTYRNQLFKYLEGCDQLKKKIIDARFSKDVFLKLFEEYSKCVNKPVKYVEKRERTIFKFYIVAGLINSNIEFSAINLSNNNSIKEKDNSMNIAFGGAVELVFPRNRRKNSIFNEILYFSNDFQTENTIIIRSNIIEVNEFQFSTSYLKFSNAYRYNFPSKKIKPFISAGIINSIMFKKELKRTTTTRFFDTERIRMSDLETFRHHGFGFLFGAGIKLKKFSLEAKVETGDGQFNLTEDISIKNQNLFILVSYNFY